MAQPDHCKLLLEEYRRKATTKSRAVGRLQMWPLSWRGRRKIRESGNGFYRKLSRAKKVEYLGVIHHHRSACNFYGQLLSIDGVGAMQRHHIRRHHLPGDDVIGQD